MPHQCKYSCARMDRPEAWGAHLCPHLFAMVYEGELAAVWGHIFVQSGRAGDPAEACPTNASIAALGWTGRRPGALNRFGDTTNAQPVPLGKPWDRQPNSGKLRRKLVSVPGLRRISGQLSPKRLSTRRPVISPERRRTSVILKVSYDPMSQ